LSRVVLDAGALIAVDRSDAAVLALLARAKERGRAFVTSSPVVGQAWRGGARQATLARLLAGVDVLAPSQADARSAGVLLATTGMADIVDALLAKICRDGDILLTSDDDDLRVLTKAARLNVEIVHV
jgi:sugar/nucleoside kinase (ribokinase family)